MAIKLWLLRAMWRATWWPRWNPLLFLDMTRLRCDGYRPIGGHMAQYCYRMRGHRGLCLARIRRTGPGEDDFACVPTQFEPERDAGVPA